MRLGIKLVTFLCLLFVLLAVSASSSFAECNRDQAFNKMMVLGHAQTKMNTEISSLPSGRAKQVKQLRWAELSKEVAMVGSTLAAEKYTEACGEYDRIAKKYDIDLEKSSSGVITMEQIRKDGGKGSGPCSQADASKKLMGMSEQLQDRAANGEISRGVLSAFFEETEPLGAMMYTDPGAVCKKLDSLKPKYELN